MTIPVICLCKTIQLVEIEMDVLNGDNLVQAVEKQLAIQSLTGNVTCWKCKAELTLDVQLNLMTKSKGD